VKLQDFLLMLEDTGTSLSVMTHGATSGPAETSQYRIEPYDIVFMPNEIFGADEDEYDAMGGDLLEPLRVEVDDDKFVVTVILTATGKHINDC
jgi:hypothetical protein